MGVYDKEPLSCPGDCDKNIYNWLRNPKWSCNLSNIYKPLVCLLINCKAVKNHPK